ncbi:hypothetical protein EYR41_000106 [Orbilia oligospora]|uniref:Uncharacterized protein n=1 Tax=Orbilia oligospora TaxID=2813651 RepID=A0A8H2E758_ORBOL|nr:hypothetical protein EYR41_000106 [Orbilia oligospora]
MHAGMLRNCDALSNSFCSFRFAKLGYIAEPIQFPLPTNCTHHAHRSPNYRTHCFGSFPNEPSQQHRKWSHVGLDQRQGIFGIFTAVADSKYTGNEVPYWDETSHRMDRNSIDLDEPPKMTRPSEPPQNSTSAMFEKESLRLILILPWNRSTLDFDTTASLNQFYVEEPYPRDESGVHRGS